MPTINEKIHEKTRISDVAAHVLLVLAGGYFLVRAFVPFALEVLK